MHLYKIAGLSLSNFHMSEVKQDLEEIAKQLFQKDPKNAVKKMTKEYFPGLFISREHIRQGLIQVKAVLQFYL